MDTPSSSRCVAKLWRRVWQVAFFLSPLAESAMRKAFCTADTLMASRDSPHCPRERTGAILPAAPDARKEPPLVAMEAPIAAQPLHHRGTDGHLAHSAALTFHDADNPALRVDMAWLQGDRLAHPQPAMVDECQ